MKAARLTIIAAAAALGASMLAACGGDDDTTTLHVLAASSLTESFDELAADFESDHPDVDVQISYDSSSILVEQLGEGIPADVLATADESTMDDAVQQDLVTGKPLPFAQNELVLVTPPDNPGNVSSLADLNDGATFAVCVPDAPCGNAGERLLKLNNITAQPATEEDNVKGVLTKVTSGDVDAGLVYVSDAKTAGDEVRTVTTPKAAQVLNTDPIAVTTDADQPDLAQQWIDLVSGTEGQKVLTDNGFRGAP